VSIKSPLWLIAFALLGFAGTAAAGFGSPTLLYETPTTDVLPVGALAISTDMSLPLRPIATSRGREENAGVRFSPYKRLDIAVTAYTFADYVLDVKYQLAGGGPGRLGLAVGVCDLGFYRYVSPVGHGTSNVWPDWKYQENGVTTRPYENLSVFAVASYRATKSIRLQAGLGRGRFVGYGGTGKYLNTDVFFDEIHQWAFGLFAGAEVYVMPQVALVAEASGRDMGGGIKVDFGPIAATVACNKLEGLLFSRGGDRFGRLGVGLTCGFNDWVGLAELLHPRGPRRELAVSVLPPPEGGPTLQGATASPDGLRLEPILFGWDSWEITPAGAASLSRNAEILLDHPQEAIVVTGHASDDVSQEANSFLSGKRAFAVFEYLKALGVPEQQMRCRAKAEFADSPLPLQRVVSFDAESGY
jgi:hypothetical protein